MHSTGAAVMAPGAVALVGCSPSQSTWSREGAEV